MNENWIVENLQNALNIWSNKFDEIIKILVESPKTFKGGGVWSVVENINGTMQVVGISLLVLFFVMGVVKTCGSFSEVKKPEHALKLFIRFAIAKGIVTYGMELMLAMIDIAQGIISSVLNNSIVSSNAYTIPNEIIAAASNLGFIESIPLWFVSLIGSLFIWVLSIVLIMSVYGRFFRLYLYTAISPIPLSTFAGEPTSSVGKSFIKSYAGVCLEGAVIVLACIIFSALSTAPPTVDTSLSAVTMTWNYIGELIFNMLVLVGTVKLSDRVVRDMMGL